MSAEESLIDCGKVSGDMCRGRCRVCEEKYAMFENNGSN